MKNMAISMLLIIVLLGGLVVYNMVELKKYRELAAGEYVLKEECEAWCYEAYSPGAGEWADNFAPAYLEWEQVNDSQNITVVIDVTS